MMTQLLINKEDNDLLKMFLATNARFSGMKTDDQIEDYVRDDENIVAEMKRLVFTRTYQKIKKMIDTAEKKEQILKELQELSKVLPSNMIKTLDEWNNDCEISDVVVLNTSLINVLKTVGSNDPQVFLQIIRCFADSKYFNKNQHLFVLYVISQTPFTSECLKTAVNRRQSFEYYFSVLDKLNLKNIHPEKVKIDLLLLDLANKIIQDNEMNEDFYAALRIAENVVTYIPVELYQNIDEYIKGRDFSDVEYDGVDLKQYMNNRFKNTNNQLDALVGYANDMKWGAPLLVECSKKITWRDKIFRKKKD